MKTNDATRNDATREVEVQAAKALGSLLGQMSSIKTKNIRFKATSPHCTNILANIDVLGHDHKLVCHVSNGEPGSVQEELQELRTRGTARGTTRMLIAPYLSPQTRALCDESRVGFLDLEGNAHLMVDEVFIGKRSCRSVTPAMATEKLSA
jgi:hypothetical protein